MTVERGTGGTTGGATYDNYDQENVAIAGGTINNTTIGATTASTGDFTTLTANATTTTTLDATTANFTTVTDLGSVTTADINGGTIDSTVQASGTINGPIAAGGTWTAAAAWTLPAYTLGGTVSLNGQSFSGTCADGGTFTTIDINGGTGDSFTIGATTPAAGTFTTLTATTPCLSDGYIQGLTLTNDTDTDHDILVSTGAARDFAGAVDMRLTTAITKQIDATWASGTNAGGLSSSLTAPANNTWYHVYLVVIAGSVDVLFDTSDTCANGVTDHSVTAYRHIGWVLTNGTANIIKFYSYEKEGGGLEIVWDVLVQDVADTAPGTSANLATLSAPKNVSAKINAVITNTTATSRALITGTDQTDTAPSSTTLQSITTTTSTWSGIETYIRTDASHQIRYRVEDTNSDVYISTLGWIDSRGI